MAAKRSSAKKKKIRVESNNETLVAEPTPTPSRNVGAWIGFVLVVIAACGWVLGHAYFVDTVTVRLCEKMDAGIPVEKRMPVFLSEIAFDGYTWNRYAEKLGEGGQWRIRHLSFDNVPEGREVHWNSPFAWYLRGLGEVYRSFTGDTIRNSIYRMSIWANPILLALAVGIFSSLAARRFGPLCGAVIATGMVAVPTFYEGFMPSYPDHHGIIAFSLLGLLFGIAWAGAGWVQSSDGADFAAPRNIHQARHGMIFSAVCGAVGLWISALSAAIVLGAIGVAMLVASGLYGRSGRKDNLLLHPELWRTWAVSGAIASIVFYLLESFPSDMGFRMEVNHPFYALAWLGGGWIIAELSAWLSNPSQRFPWTRLILPLLACSVLPLTVLIGGAAVYSPRDLFLWQLHKNIAEFLPLLTRIQLGGLTWGMAFGWFPAFVVAAIVLQFFPSVGRGTKAVLIFLAIPIVLITSLQFYQVRWGMLVGPLYIALTGIVIPQAWRLVPPHPRQRAIAALVLVACGFVFVEPSFKNAFTVSWGQFSAKDNIPITSGQGLALIHRQMARAILDDADGKPVVLLSSPNSSCLLSGIGGFTTIGTLYWENVDGLKKAAEALNAQSDPEALELLQKYGVTHVSMMTWENFIQPYFHILYPERPAGKSFEASFGKRALFDQVIPAWSRALLFPPNDLTKGLKQTVLMLRVAPEQSMEEAKFHLARFARHVEGNPIAAEISLRGIVEQVPSFLPATVELVSLQLEQKRFAQVAESLVRAFPDDPAAKSFASAASLAEQKRTGEAIEAAQRSLNSQHPVVTESAKALIRELAPGT